MVNAFGCRALLRVAAVIASLAALLTSARPAKGQSDTMDPPTGETTEPLVEETTTVTLGVGVGYAPEFLGAGDYEISAVPLVRVANFYGFTLAPFSVSYDLVSHRSANRLWGVKAGPYVALDFGRDEGDSEFLEGTGDVGTSVLAGGFVNLRYGPAMLSVTGAQDLAGGHEGFVINNQASVRFGVTDKLMVVPGLSATWASENYMQSFFGITAAQSAGSIYDQFDADAGVRDVGLNLSVQYEVFENWLLTGLVSYSRLVGDAAESPIVEGPGGSEDQVRVVFGVTRRFSF